MRKQIFFAHSGGPQVKPGQGSFDFVQRLREDLEPGYSIHFPIIEEPEYPTYEIWKSMLDRELCKMSGEVILAGHSLGGSVLVKFLSENVCQFKPAGLFLIAAPWWGPDGWGADEFALDTGSVKFLPKLSGIHIYHCTDDPVVPYGHAKRYKKLFPDAFLHELAGSDHTFSRGLPQLVEQIKCESIAANKKEV